MTYIVTPENLTKLNLAPTSIVEEVLQNVAIIISTPKYSVPMSRELGLENDFLDKPMPVVEALLMVELHEQLEDFEPRAQIIEVSIKKNELLGKICPCVEVEIVEEDEQELP